MSIDADKLFNELQAFRQVDTVRERNNLKNIEYCNKVLTRVFGALGVKHEHIFHREFRLTCTLPDGSSNYFDVYNTIVVAGDESTYEYDQTAKKWLLTRYLVDDVAIDLSDRYADFYYQMNDVYHNLQLVYNDDYSKLDLIDEGTGQMMTINIPTMKHAMVLKFLHTLPFDRVNKLYTEVSIYPIVEAHKTVVAFLIVRWYKDSIFTIIPKDVIRIIAKKIWESRYAWYGF